MPEFELEIRNYRCFPASNPLRLSLRPGFVSFVGINNAGKSSILRFFWEFGPLIQHYGSPTGNLINALSSRQSSVSARISPGEEAASKFNTGDIEIAVRWQFNSTPHEFVYQIARPSDACMAKLTVAGNEVRPEGLRFEETRLMKQGGEGVTDLAPFFEITQFLGGGMYLGPFRNAINVGATERYYDIAVGQQFISEFHQFKSGGNAAQNEAIFALIQDIKRIFGFKDFDVNADPSTKTLQVIIDGRSFRLSELGAGIAQFIIVLANVLVRRPTVIFIDEPEANLHPTLQLDFLTTLAAYSSEASLWFATHNLGLARAASDMIYSCRRLELGVSDVKPLEQTAHLAEFLGELGYSAYRDLGFDSILLVEGPTEVKTFQQFLRHRGKDHQVVILQLGGDSMINAKSEAELTEVARIGAKVHCVIDSERATQGATLSANRAAFQSICKKLAIPLLVLERRATENYFPDAAIKTALGPKFSALGEYEHLKAAVLPWGKRDNWRIARAMKAVDLAGTDLGSFLDNL